MIFVLAEQPSQLKTQVALDGVPPSRIRLRVFTQQTDLQIGSILLPEQFGNALVESGIFTSERQIALLAQEVDEHVAGVIMIVMLKDEFLEIDRMVGDIGEQGERIRTTVTAYEPGALSLPYGEIPHVLIPLGEISRPKSLRKHPAQLDNEVADMLSTLLYDIPFISDDQRAIEELLSRI